MAKRYSVSYILEVPSIGRTISDDAWDLVEPTNLGTWKAATSVLTTREFEVTGGNTIVDMDWTPSLRKYRRRLSSYKRLKRKIDDGLFSDLGDVRFPSQSAKHVIRVTSEANTGLIYYAELASYDIFLMLNIAAPSCCDFQGAKIYSPKDNRPRERTNLSLSNFLFETALLVFLDDGWPPIRAIEIDKVRTWYDSVRSNTSQVPHNPMERVVFALFHMAELGLSPITVVWQFYAFESLLQTRVGENFGQLVNRLAMLLDADDKKFAALKRKLRALYDIRSAIVHGGFEVVHPMHNEIMDEAVDRSYEKTASLIDFGHAVLLAAIQRTIVAGWRYPIFEERLTGVEF